MQKRSLVVLFLLAVFGFGLFAGPHPCAAAHGEREKSAPPSCHAAAHPASGPEVRTDASPADDRKNCCDTFCQHACHMTAVAEAMPVALTIAPVSQTVAEAPGSGAPPFALPIDHIPLG
ncbi:MAG TPA: hypothetical protein VF789_20370 [Thermoanaerobaculia bacterium]